VKPSLIIVGLGNPGAQYKDTRHNVGFRAVEALAQEFGTGEWKEQQKFAAMLCEGRVVTVPTLLIQPTTYMNNSGQAVRKLAQYYKLDPANQLVVLCDDVDLPVGEVRISDAGGAGSHNGLKSLTAEFGDSFPRVRIGIRSAQAPQGSFQQAGEDLAAYVLSVPSSEDRTALKEAIATLPTMVRDFVLQNEDAA